MRAVGLIIPVALTAIGIPELLVVVIKAPFPWFRFTLLFAFIQEYYLHSEKGSGRGTEVPIIFYRGMGIFSALSFVLCTQ